MRVSQFGNQATLYNALIEIDFGFKNKLINENDY